MSTSYIYPLKPHIIHRYRYKTEASCLVPVLPRLGETTGVKEQIIIIIIIVTPSPYTYNK